MRFRGGEAFSRTSAVRVWGAQCEPIIWMGTAPKQTHGWILCTISCLEIPAFLDSVRLSWHNSKSCCVFLTLKAEKKSLVFFSFLPVQLRMVLMSSSLPFGAVQAKKKRIPEISSQPSE